MKVEGMIRSAAYRAHLKFRVIPGYYLEPDDFHQVGLMEVMNLGPRLNQTSPGLLNTILTRRMIDYGRSRMDISRNEHRSIAQGMVTPTTLVSIDQENENGLTIGDFLAASAHPVDSRIDASRIRLAIESNEVGLRTIELKIVRRYWFDEETLHVIAAELGLSQSRVSKIKTLALEKLRRFMEETRRTLPEKTCICGCQTSYIPTSNVQKFAPGHKPLTSKSAKVKTVKHSQRTAIEMVAPQIVVGASSSAFDHVIAQIEQQLQLFTQALETVKSLRDAQ